MRPVREAALRNETDADERASAAEHGRRYSQQKTSYKGPRSLGFGVPRRASIGEQETRWMGPLQGSKHYERRVWLDARRASYFAIRSSLSLKLP